MAINLMAPKGSDENVKLSSDIWNKLNEVRAQKAQATKKVEKKDTSK